MKNSVAIESLRAWMAWWVVIGHAFHLSGAGEFLHPTIAKIIGSFGTPVFVFIIVSGFVITNLILMKKEPYGKYITRRALRIYPIYIVCMGISLIVIDLYTTAYTSGSWITESEMRLGRAISQNKNFWSHIILHLTMLHGILPDTALPFSGTAFLAPAWSLSLEWQFYLLAPLLVALLSGRTSLMLATTIMLLLLNVVFTQGYFGTWLAQSFLPLAIQYFLVGIFSRLILEYRPMTRLPPELLLMAGITIVAFAGELAMLVWVLFFTIVLYELGYIARASKPFSLFARLIALNPYVSTVGKWSYSTYLIHIPIFAIVVGGAIKIFGPQSQTNYVVLLALCMPIIFVVSFVLYRFIETPFIDLGRRLTSRASTTPSLPAVSG